jgi:hypothetical protein
MPLQGVPEISPAPTCPVSPASAEIIVARAGEVNQPHTGEG